MTSHVSQRAEGSPLLDNIQTSMHLEKDTKFEKQAYRLKRCGTDFNVFMCNCGFKKVRKRCNYRICHYCGKIRSFKAFEQFIGPLKKRKIARSIYDSGLRFVTFTIKNQEELVGAMDKLYESLKKFRRRKYFKKLSAGLGSIDVTRDENGLWHVHTHMIIDSSFLDMKSHKKTGQDSELVREWKECTGGDGIVYVERVRTHESALGYTLKYLTKGLTNLTSEERAIFFKKTLGRRFIFTFKEFYGIKVIKKKYLCPECGSSRQYIFPNSEEYNLFLGKDPFYSPPRK